jgi:hypothetical protein
MSLPSDAPASTGVLFPELLGTPEPAPPVRPRGSRVLRTLARVALWSLIVLGAIRGLAPAPEADPGPPVATANPPDHRPEAVATAFMREYLTLGGDQATRAGRLGRFTVDGLDLRRSVSIPAGAVQYADHVVAFGSRPVEGGTEVTVLAHLLLARSGTYDDGGTVAFAVPLVVRRDGVAVSGPPRPARLPVASGLTLPRPRPAPVELSRVARRVARQAVVAFVVGDGATLARLGGRQRPPTRPLPTGWRATSVGNAEVHGPPGDLIAEVSVRARPPMGPVSYVVPVRVHLEAGQEGVTVRHIDGGGSA